jgi:hypothetical protein
MFDDVELPSHTLGDIRMRIRTRRQRLKVLYRCTLKKGCFCTGLGVCGLQPIFVKDENHFLRVELGGEHLHEQITRANRNSKTGIQGDVTEAHW